MVIFIILHITGLVLPLLLQGAQAQAQNTQVILGANIVKDKDTAKQSLLSNSSSSKKGYNTTLHFDDIPTDAESGTGPLSIYSYLNFTSFVAVNAPTAVSLGSISIHDADCASSQPNALFSVSGNQPKPRPRWISSPADLHAAGLSTYFNLKGLSIKPLGRVPRGLVLEIIAWEVLDSVAVNVYNAWVAYQQEGYQSMERYNFTLFWDDWGRNVNMVEVAVWAPDGTEMREWGFCVDDLEIEFLDRKSED